MTTTATAQAPCPHCGAPTDGAFCSHCGAPRAGTSCRSCAAPLSTGARFCSRCGTSIGASAGRPSRDRLPWLIAGAALLALLALILLKVPGQAAGAPTAQSEARPVDASPPDISNMSPRERFNRLYNRVMQAAEGGDA